MGVCEVKFVNVFRDDARRGYGMNIIEEVGGVESLVMLDGSRVDLAGMGWPAQVTALMSDENAQAIMDRLWADGLRPRGVDGGTGVVDAMRAHLASKDKHIEDIKHFATIAASNTMVVMPDAKGGV